MRVILLGPPGAGKGTQAQFIKARCHIPQISTSDLLRGVIATDSPIAKHIRQVMEAGELVSDEIILSLVKDRIQKTDCQEGYLFDGFPRTLHQAEAMRDMGIAIDAVIEIQIDDEEIVKRMSGRRVHLSSGRTYHVMYNPPKTADQDDVTGEALVQRTDDKEDTVRKRLSVYHVQTKPLVDYYKNWAKMNSAEAPRYCVIDGLGEVEHIRQQIEQILCQ